MAAPERQIVVFRGLQVLVIVSLGLFGGLVFLGNILDYNANFQFVKHVLSMDTVFEGNTQKWRAIENDTLHHACYLLLIVAEGIFTLLCLWGGADLARRLTDKKPVFAAAKTKAYYGIGVGLLIWLIGFVVVGSEWFGMWQSTVWNGKDTAMQISFLLISSAILTGIEK